MTFKVRISMTSADMECFIKYSCTQWVQKRAKSDFFYVVKVILQYFTFMCFYPGAVQLKKNKQKIPPEPTTVPWAGGPGAVAGSADLGPPDLPPVWPGAGALLPPV